MSCWAVGAGFYRSYRLLYRRVALALGPGWGPSTMNREQLSLEVIQPSSRVLFKNTSSENGQSLLELNLHVWILALN